MKYNKKIMKIVAAFSMLFAIAGMSEAAKYKIGVSVPSADHGWTAGLLW